MRPLLFAASVVAASAVAAGQGDAKPGNPPAAAPTGSRTDDMARSFFGKLPAKSPGFACFERIYDASHLARHPLQKVGSMLLLVRGEMIPEDPVPNYSFSLSMTYKGQSSRLASAGWCGHASAATAGTGLSCGVDCDGGSLDVTLANDAKSTLVSLERIAIWPEGTAAEDADRLPHLDAGADDKSFRLQRVALSRCARLAKDAAETAALK